MAGFFFLISMALKSIPPATRYPMFYFPTQNVVSQNSKPVTMWFYKAANLWHINWIRAPPSHVRSRFRIDRLLQHWLSNYMIIYDTEHKPSSSCLVFWNPRIAVLGPLVHILHLGSVLRSLDIWIGENEKKHLKVPTYLKPCDCWDGVAMYFEEAEDIFAFSWGELVWRFDELRLLSFCYDWRWFLLPILRNQNEKMFAAKE